MKINISKLTLSISSIMLLGIISGLVTAPAIGTWYANLVKPAFNPPNFLFGPVWTLLYILMGISFYLVWTSKSKNKQFALRVFGIHFAVNIAWSFLFFGLRSPLLGLIDIVILLGLIVYVLKLFWPINNWAAYLLVPYLLWVIFATILNFAVWSLN